jgi:hypothetical protein
MMFYAVFHLSTKLNKSPECFQMKIQQANEPQCVCRNFEKTVGIAIEPFG